jgi:hypothetical protein
MVDREVPVVDSEVPVEREVPVVDREVTVVEHKVPVVERGISVLSRIRDQVCEAIAVSTTEDNKWMTLRRIQKYFNEFSDIEPSKVRRNLVSTLRDLERQGILVRRHNAVTFCSAETAEFANPPKKRRRKKKTPAEEPRRLGPDVVLTSSGRISYRRSE